MSEKRPSFKDMDRDGDGITGHEKGMANPGPGWVSENSGKLILFGIILGILVFVVAIIEDANRAKDAVG